MFDTILTALQPHIMELLGLLITALIAWAAARLREWTGVQIEEKHQRALHSALMTGLQAAMFKGLTGRTAVEAAVEYAHRSTPDAIRKLAPGRDTLTNLAEAKWRELVRK